MSEIKTGGEGKGRRKLGGGAPGTSLPHRVIVRGEHLGRKMSLFHGFWGGGIVGKGRGSKRGGGTPRPG